MSEPQKTTPKLQDAPKEIKLAVDLIQLLEENNIEVDTAIAALEMVLTDFKNKKNNNNFNKSLSV